MRLYGLNRLIGPAGTVEVDASPGSLDGPGTSIGLLPARISAARLSAASSSAVWNNLIGLMPSAFLLPLDLDVDPDARDVDRAAEFVLAISRGREADLILATEVDLLSLTNEPVFPLDAVTDRARGVDGVPLLDDTDGDRGAI